MALPPDLQYLSPLLDVLVELVLEDLRVGDLPTPDKELAPNEDSRESRSAHERVD